MTLGGHRHRFNLQIGPSTVMCRCRETREICSRCRFAFVWARGLCRLCYEYQRQFGRPRPESAIQAHARRLLRRRDPQSA